MANPQAENGHIDIANELGDKFCSYRINGEEWMILWCIFRKTYGWHKKEDSIPLSQFCKMTGMKKQNVHRAIKSLLLKKIIEVKKNTKEGFLIYKFNKDYDQWDQSLKIVDAVITGDDSESSRAMTKGTYAVITGDDSESSRAMTKESSRAMTSKEKEKKRKKVATFPEDSYPYRLSAYLWKKIFENFPKIKKPDLQKWAIHVDLMIRIDKREPNDIGKIIAWAQKDEFWKKNILSTKKLREQFDNIQAKMGGLK